MKNQLNKILRVAVYLRLSAEDGDKIESNSISNQRTLIHGYLQEHKEFSIVKEFIDDGYSGTNFDRPGFQEMMKFLKNGGADCVIVKDLSRLGRDFSGVLRYVERIFPQMGIRFIAITDGYDNAKMQDQILTVRMKSLVNDIYPADTSRAVRANLLAKMKNGECVSPFTVYGYIRNPENKNQLIPDPYAGEIVKDIFRWALEGYNRANIAEKLENLGILTPLEYKKSIGSKFHTGFQTKSKCVWSSVMVKRILTNIIYMGTLAQGKRTTPNHKVKTVIYKPQEEWTYFENAHKPLIDKHTFEVVQHLLSKDMRKSPKKRIFPLSGLVQCAKCRENMVITSPDKQHFYYKCVNHQPGAGCESGRINAEKLKETVEKAILYQISLLAEMQDVMDYIGQLSLSEEAVSKADRKMKKLDTEYKKLIQIKAKLYVSYTDGILTKEEYLEYKSEYNRQSQQIQDAIIQQKEETKKLFSKIKEKQQWIEEFLEYQDCKQIDRKMLVMLVKDIYIHTKKEIEIVFWFQDEYETAVSLIEAVDRLSPNPVTKQFLGKKEGIESA